MNNTKHSSEKIKSEDKCDNCGATHSEQFWDYDNHSVLCNNCHDEIGDEWYAKVGKELSPKEKHKKNSLGFDSRRKTNMKKYVIAGAIFIAVLILAFSARNIIAGNPSSDYSTNTQVNNLAASGTGVTTGSVQNAKLALVDFSYKLTPNKLVKGVPVRIEVDASTLAGCMTTVVIKDFGVKKRITAKDNIIEFTPDKTGLFWITCGMGMGPGSFEVVNSDGTSDPNAKAQATASKPPSGGSCGAGGGGCGCGGG